MNNNGHESLAKLISAADNMSEIDPNEGGEEPADCGLARPLTADEVKEFEELAKRARSANKRGVALLIEIKDILYRAHALHCKVGRDGEYSAWVAEHFPDMSQRTAERYLQVHRVFAAANNDTLSRFEVSALYILSETHVPARGRALALSIADGGERITAATARMLVAATSGNRLPKTLTSRVKMVKAEHIQTSCGEVIIKPVNNTLNVKEALEEAMRLNAAPAS